MLILLSSMTAKAQPYTSCVGGNPIYLPDPNVPSPYTLMWAQYSYAGSELYVVNNKVTIEKYFVGTIYVECYYKCVRQYTVAGHVYEDHQTNTTYFGIKCDPVYTTGLPDQLTMQVGETKTIDWSYRPSYVSRPNLTWTSSDYSVVDVNSNRLTAKKSGRAVVTVKSNAGPDESISVTVEGGPDVIYVSSISLNETSVSLTEGSTKQLQATVLPSNATDKSVSWTSSNDSVAQVSSSGLVTAKSVGTATITCKANDGSGKSATCSVTVNSSIIEPTSISLPSSKTVKVGESFTMTYTLTPSNATTTLTWTSDDTNIATVSSSGVVNGIKAGTTKIRVKTTNGITDYCSVIVEDNDNKGIGDGTLQNPFNAIAASNKAMELGVGETSSQSYYVKGKISSIKYSYSAQYGTATFYISDDGTTNNQFYAYGAYYLENKPWEEGNPQITVGDDVILYGKMTNYNWVLEMANKENYIYSHNGRTSISNSIEPTSISLPPSITIKVGETIILTPSIYPTGAEATISGTFGNNGTISASYDNENNQFIIRGLKEGTSFQTVTTGNGLSARCEIVVRGYNPTAIGNGTLENPFNAVGAFIYACSLPINEESEESVYIKGKVLSIKEQFDSQYGNATFYISDDGTINNSFYVYRTYYLGNRKFSEGDRPIQEGDEILIYGKVIIWSNGTRYVPETSQNSSYLVSVNGAGGYTNTYQINLSNAGYATFYDSQSAYSLPNGISAQVVTSALNGKLTYKTIADGSVSGILPKGTAVMLTNEAKRSGTFTLTAAESNTYYLGTNLLHGSDEATTTTGDGYHYKLSYGPTGTKWDNVFGWYWGANDGAPFQIKEHKAWLVVPRGNGTRAAGFSIEGDVLGIETLDELADSPLNLYFDLQGRRVSQPTKRGVYVSNGKKIILK